MPLTLVDRMVGGLVHQREKWEDHSVIFFGKYDQELMSINGNREKETWKKCLGRGRRQMTNGIHE